MKSRRKMQVHVEDLSASARRFVELVRFVRRHPHLSIAAVARELGRDYKRVHGDVRALEAAGLVEEDEDGLIAPYAGVEAQLSF